MQSNVGRWVSFGFLWEMVVTIHFVASTSSSLPQAYIRGSKVTLYIMWGGSLEIEAIHCAKTRQSRFIVYHQRPLPLKACHLNSLPNHDTPSFNIITSLFMHAMSHGPAHRGRSNNESLPGLMSMLIMMV